MAWSPDGQEVGFTVEHQTGNGLLYDLYLAPTNGSQGNPTLLLADRAGRHGFTEDGPYLTFDTNDRYFFGWRPLP